VLEIGEKEAEEEKKQLSRAFFSLLSRNKVDAV